MSSWNLVTIDPKLYILYQLYILISFTLYTFYQLYILPSWDSVRSDPKLNIVGKRSRKKGDLDQVDDLKVIFEVANQKKISIYEVIFAFWDFETFYWLHQEFRTKSPVGSDCLILKLIKCDMKLLQCFDGIFLFFF